jgi:hypothetical protein
MTSEPEQKQNEAEKQPEPELKEIQQAALLPEAMRPELRELLVQGATIEGAAQSVNARVWDDPALKPSGQRVRYNVTCDAIREYYNADRELQCARAQYLVEGTEAITRSLSKTGNLKEGEARYIEAVVMTGLARINDKDAPLSIKDSLRARAERDVLELKIRLAKLKAAETMWHRAYEKSQKALLDQKKEFVFEQTVKLRDMMRKLEKKKNLTPETIRKIQETYGILAENVAQATAGSTAAEPEASLAASMSDSGDIDPEPFFFVNQDDVVDPMEEVRRQLEEQSRLNELEQGNEPSGD